MNRLVILLLFTVAIAMFAIPIEGAYTVFTYSYVYMTLFKKAFFKKINEKLNLVNFVCLSLLIMTPGILYLFELKLWFCHLDP